MYHEYTGKRRLRSWQRDGHRTPLDGHAVAFIPSGRQDWLVDFFLALRLRLGTLWCRLTRNIFASMQCRYRSRHDIADHTTTVCEETTVCYSHYTSAHKTEVASRELGEDTKIGFVATLSSPIRQYMSLVDVSRRRPFV